MTWIMYAHKFVKDGVTYFRHVGDKRWVELHLLDDPIYKVKVEQDDNGIHWGWMDTDKDKPCMIWAHLSLLKVCFPYGLEAAEKAGQGKRIQLTITEIPEDLE